MRTDLDVITNAMSSAHLEENTVVHHREICVSQTCAHYSISIGIWRSLENKDMDLNSNKLLT